MRGCRTRRGRAEQASQTDKCLAVGLRLRLALGVPEGLVLVGTDVHDDRTSSTAGAVRGGGCPRDPDLLGTREHRGTGCSVKAERFADDQISFALKRHKA